MNLHGITTTRPSTWRVCQFRHSRSGPTIIQSTNTDSEPSSSILNGIRGQSSRLSAAGGSHRRQRRPHRRQRHREPGEECHAPGDVAHRHPTIKGQGRDIAGREAGERVRIIVREPPVCEVGREVEDERARHRTTDHGLPRLARHEPAAEQDGPGCGRVNHRGHRQAAVAGHHEIAQRQRSERHARREKRMRENGAGRERDARHRCHVPARLPEAADRADRDERHPCGHEQRPGLEGASAVGEGRGRGGGTGRGELHGRPKPPCMELAKVPIH